MPPSNPGPRIKAEAGQYQPTGSPSIGYPISQIPQLPPGTMNAVAQQRAAQALQQQYGSRAAAQVNQLQQSSNQRQQSGLPTPQFQEAEDRKPALPNFSPPAPQSRTPLQSAQHDGGNDSLAEWKAEVARRRGMAVTSGTGDRLFHEYMLQKQQQIEGGGLMVPLHERHMPSAGAKRRVDALFGTDEEQQPRRVISPPGSLLKVQGDAPGDEDDDEKDLDEDAINSDLDDPEDNGDHLEDETVEQVMLCTYDKVQRVKNKWKCTLKDGILRVANKEYVEKAG
jgi:transcription initiation factor TFIIA large subunit